MCEITESTYVCLSDYVVRLGRLRTSERKPNVSFVQDRKPVRLPIVSNSRLNTTKVPPGPALVAAGHQYDDPDFRE